MLFCFFQEEWAINSCIFIDYSYFYIWLEKFMCDMAKLWIRVETFFGIEDNNNYFLIFLLFSRSLRSLCHAYEYIMYHAAYFQLWLWSNKQNSSNQHFLAKGHICSPWGCMMRHSLTIQISLEHFSLMWTTFQFFP